MRPSFSFLVADLIVAPLPAIAQQAAHIISVSGQGEVTAHPDMATLDVAVVVTHPRSADGGEDAARIDGNEVANNVTIAVANFRDLQFHAPGIVGAPILPGTITISATAYVTTP